MSTHQPINDPVACSIIRKLGEEGLVSIGALLHIWEGGSVKVKDKTHSVSPEPSKKSASPECILDREFVDSTRLELTLASYKIKNMGEEIKILRNELESRRKESLGLRVDLDKTHKILEESVEMMKNMKEEMEDTKEDMGSLLKINKDIYEKLESIETEHDHSSLGKRSMCPDPYWFDKKIKVVEEIDAKDFDAVADMLE